MTAHTTDPTARQINAIQHGGYEVEVSQTNHLLREVAKTLAEDKARLEYLRDQINAERVSYGELAELADLADHIDPSDVQLLEWAGVPEGE